MPTPTFRVRSAVPALLGTLLFAFAIAAPAVAGSRTTPGALRVVDSAGKTLAEGTQFAGASAIKTSRKADCFGPGTGGTGDSVDVPGPTAISQLAYGGAAFPGIDPLGVTDAFSFGLGLCGIGKATAPSTGYWYLKVNHASASTGADQTEVSRGDEILWYLIADFTDPTPDELALKAPNSAEPGEQVMVKVTSYADDGTRSAASGVAVSGAAELTDADGEVVITADEGVSRLQATRTGSIPSNRVVLCTDEARECPAGFAETVGGTPRADRITGSGRAEEILAGAGKDDVDARKGSSRDRINCGPGKDTLVLTKGSKSRFTSCEKVSLR